MEYANMYMKNNRSSGKTERRAGHHLLSLMVFFFKVTAPRHSPPRPKLLRSLGPPELLLTGRLVAGQESANQGYPGSLAFSKPGRLNRNTGWNARLSINCEITLILMQKALLFIVSFCFMLLDSEIMNEKKTWQQLAARQCEDKKIKHIFKC